MPEGQKGGQKSSRVKSTPGGGKVMKSAVEHSAEIKNKKAMPRKQESDSAIPQGPGMVN